MAVQTPIDPVNELQAAFRVLLNNWILAIPTALVSLIAAIFAVFMIAGFMASVMGAGLTGMHPGMAGALLGAGGLTLFVGVIILVLLSLLAHATVIGAAEHVWRGQAADLPGGFAKAMAKLGPLFVLFIILCLIGLVCAILTPLLGLGLIVGLVLAFFFMYSLPAIVVGNRSATEALGDSWRLVRANTGPSIIAFIGIIVVSIVGQIIITLFHAIPFLHVIVSFIVGGLTAAFVALVLVRFYDLLSGTGRAMVAPPSPTMPRV